MAPHSTDAPSMSQERCTSTAEMANVCCGYSCGYRLCFSMLKNCSTQNHRSPRDFVMTEPKRLSCHRERQQVFPARKQGVEKLETIQENVEADMLYLKQAITPKKDGKTFSKKKIKQMGNSKSTFAKKGKEIPSQEALPIRKNAEEETIQIVDELQKVVRQLEFGNDEQQERAAVHIRRIVKADPQTRAILAKLGSIPRLVSMLSASQHSLQNSAVLALLNLAIGNEVNKAAIVKAGAVPRMVKLLKIHDVGNQEAVLAAFLSLSVLDVNKQIIGSSGVARELVNLIASDNAQARKDSLRILCNLSLCLENVGRIVDAEAVAVLLSAMKDMEVTQMVLAVLSNLVSTDEGRKAIAEINNDAYPILIDILGWADAPSYQERSVYVLMMISHHSRTEREAMIRAGVVSPLMELTLLGSALAQRRASRILETMIEDEQGCTTRCLYASSVASAGVTDHDCMESSSVATACGSDNKAENC